MQTIRDLNANMQVVNSLAPAATTGSRNGASVDISGAETAVALLHVGAVTTLNDTDKLTLTVLTSDTDDVATGVAIDADAYLGPRDQDGTVWARVLNLAFAAASRVYQVGFINKGAGKKYAFLVLTAAGSPSAIVGGSIALGSLREAPNS